MKKKSIISMIILFASIIVYTSFVPKNIALPDYNDAVINIIKRVPSADTTIESDTTIELTEQEKKEFYSILKDIKGIYMPKIIAEYTSHGRTSYEISIYSKSKGDDYRFFVLFDYDNQPLARVRNNLKDSYRKIINSDNLVGFLRTL